MRNLWTGTALSWGFGVAGVLLLFRVPQGWALAAGLIAYLIAWAVIRRGRP